MSKLVELRYSLKHRLPVQLGTYAGVNLGWTIHFVRMAQVLAVRACILF